MCAARVQKRSCQPTARTDDVINNRVQAEAENARPADVILQHQTEQRNSANVSLPAEWYAGASIPIYRWRQMRQCAMVIFFLGGGSIKSLILSFNIITTMWISCTNLISNIFALYSFPIIFSKIFSLAALAPLPFTPHLEMKPCNVLYQHHLYFFVFFWGGSHYHCLTASKIHWKHA